MRVAPISVCQENHRITPHPTVAARNGRKVSQSMRGWSALASARPNERNRSFMRASAGERNDGIKEIARRTGEGSGEQTEMQTGKRLRNVRANVDRINHVTRRRGNRRHEKKTNAQTAAASLASARRFGESRPAMRTRAS